jgi:hypothetical protein
VRRVWLGVLAVDVVWLAVAVVLLVSETAAGWRVVQGLSLWVGGWVAGVAALGLAAERRTSRQLVGEGFEWRVGLQRKANRELHVHLLARRPAGEGVEVVDLSMLPWTANEIGERLRQTAVEADMSNKSR